jgi:hypothetical protein
MPTCFDDRKTRNVKSHRKVQPIQKDVPSNFWLKKTEVDTKSYQVMTRGRLTVIVWKYRRLAYLLSYTDEAPAEGNLCDERENALTALTVECYKVLKMVTAMQ